MRIGERLIPLREPPGSSSDGEENSEHVGGYADRSEHDACHVDGPMIEVSGSEVK